MKWQLGNRYRVMQGCQMKSQRHGRKASRRRQSLFTMMQTVYVRSWHLVTYSVVTGTIKLYLWPPCLGARTTCPLLPSPIHLIRTNGDSVNKKMGEHVPSRRSADNHLAMWIKANNQWQWQIGGLAAQHVDVSLISAACYTAHHATCTLYCNVDFSMIVSWLLLPA